MFSTLFTAFEILGTVAFAISGAMVAIEKRVDLFGVLFLGFVTAMGGGVVRYITLGDFPPRMFRDSTNLLLALSTSLVVFFLARLLQRRCGFIWGELLACMFFLVAAACWLYTLAQGWPAWDAALAAGRLEAGQRQCLRITSVTGAISAMIPLLAQIPGALKKH